MYSRYPTSLAVKLYVMCELGITETRQGPVY